MAAGSGLCESCSHCKVPPEFATPTQMIFLGYREENLDDIPVEQQLFSDESKFCISFGNQGSSRVWWKTGEAQDPSCLKFSVKHPLVIVWGVMSSVGVGPLCFFNFKVNA